MKHVSNSFYLIVTHGEFFSLAPTPFNTLKHFPTFHYRSSCICVFPIFSLLQRSELPLKDTQGFNKSLKAFWHICPLQTNKIALMSFQYPTTFFVSYATSIVHHPPPISKISPKDTWNQSLITNFFSFNPSAVQVKSLQAKFTDKHAQDFSWLASTSTYKVKRVSPWVSLKIINRITNMYVCTFFAIIRKSKYKNLHYLLKWKK